MPGWCARFMENRVALSGSRAEARRMTHISHIGVMSPKRGPLTPAQKMNAVLPFSKRPPCPACGATTLLRTRKIDSEVFWGCSTYSKCSGSIPIDPKKFKAAYDALEAAARR